MDIYMKVITFERKPGKLTGPWEQKIIGSLNF
jgi:hypothetical protein